MAPCATSGRGDEVSSEMKCLHCPSPAEGSGRKTADKCKCYLYLGPGSSFPSILFGYIFLSLQGRESVCRRLSRDCI